MALAPGALSDIAQQPEHLRQLEQWMRSYQPEELFDERRRAAAGSGALAAGRAAAHGRQPARERRELLRDLMLPDFRDYAVEVPGARADDGEATRVLGGWLRDVDSADARNFRLFGPDETASNRLERCSRRPTAPGWPEPRERRGPRARWPRDGGSERAPLPGLARGLSAHGPPRPLHLLRGVHPHRRLHVQPARQVAEGDPRGIPWRRPIASLNYLLSSHVWRQDHNGFSHQDPGFIDHVVNKKADIIRVYLPPDANCLLSVADHCLRPALRQRRSSRASSPAPVAHMEEAAGTAPGYRDLGVGVQRRRRRAGRGDGVPATCRRSRRWRLSRSCASTFPSSRCAW